MSIKLACKPQKAIMWTNENINLTGTITIDIYTPEKGIVTNQQFTLNSIDDFIFAMQNKSKVVLAEIVQNNNINYDGPK